MVARAVTPLGIAVLALLCEGPMHPYEMYQLLLARKDDRIVKLRPGSLYHSVDRLAEQHLVEQVGTERDGNRPERTTYRVTDAGRSALTDRISEIVETPINEYPQFVLALSEIHNLPVDRALELLRRRTDNLAAESAELAHLRSLAARREVPEIFFVGIDYLSAIIAAESAWLVGFVEKVQSGEIEWLTDDMMRRLAARETWSSV